MRSHLNLESVRFSDWLSNGGRQCWYIPSERADPGRIRPQVERYITDNSATTCPIEHVAIQDNQDDVSLAISGSEEEGRLDVDDDLCRKSRLASKKRDGVRNRSLQQGYPT